MSIAEKFDIGPSVISAAVRAQNLANLPLFGRLIGLAIDSDSPAYSRLAWRNVDTIVDEDGGDFTLPIAEGDRSARALSGLVPRLKDKVTVVDTPAKELNFIRARSALFSVVGSSAVAFTIEDSTFAGLLPEGCFIKVQIPHEGSYYSAMREGAGHFGVGMGYFTEKDRVLHVPKATSIAAQHLPISGIETVYDGIILT